MILKVVKYENQTCFCIRFVFVKFLKLWRERDFESRITLVSSKSDSILERKFFST